MRRHFSILSEKYLMVFRKGLRDGNDPYFFKNFHRKLPPEWTASSVLSTNGRLPAPL